MICNECETVAHYLKNGCVPKTTKQTEAMKLALEALEWQEPNKIVGLERATNKAIIALREALALVNEVDQEQPAPVAEPRKQEPVAWNVIDPLGKVVATETNAVRGWARIDGYKPTVEGLLGFHEQGWRVVPTTPPAQRTWVHATTWRGLTDEDVTWLCNTAKSHEQTWGMFVRTIEAKLRSKNEASILLLPEMR